MPQLEGLEVIASTIHGYGVRTTRPFQSGEIVCVGDGVLYPSDADFDDTYSLILPSEQGDDGDDVFFDLVDQTRWFNHSCDPNTEVCSSWDPKSKAMRAWWVALRDIEVGEEITYDYGFVAEVAEACLCGAASCRGVIVDADPQEQLKLPPHLAALLRTAAALSSDPAERVMRAELRDHSATATAAAAPIASPSRT